MNSRDYVTAVQHSALKRALVEGDDARRYFALAGTLDDVAEPVDDTLDVDTPSSAGADADADAAGVLQAAMLSLAVVPYLADAEPSPSVPTTIDPWTVTPERGDGDTTQPAVRRGARLALRWFDVSPEHVAARARLPESALITSVE